MQKFIYGPLIYNTWADSEESGNYYWPGSPPVGYDEMGIPVDEAGNQCLDVSSPLHPSYVPTETEWNELIGDYLPVPASILPWFEDAGLIVDERLAKRYIVRWYEKCGWKRPTRAYGALSHQCTSVEEVIDKLWPPEQTS